MKSIAKYRKNVLNVLKVSSQPLSVDAVRFRSKIPSWSTARAALLELLADGQIRGMKTSKSWVFWMPRSESEGVRSIDRKDEGGS